MLYSGRSLSSVWTHLWYFHRSSLSISKVIAEKLLATFHDLKWPWGYEEGSLVAIFRFKIPLLPVARRLRVLRILFVKKRRLSIFSRWLIMERSQNWPERRSPISEFWYINLIDAVTRINCWKFQGNRSVDVAMMRIHTFYEVRSLDVLWWVVTWSWVTFVWNFHITCEKHAWIGLEVVDVPPPPPLLSGRG